MSRLFRWAKRWACAWVCASTLVDESRRHADWIRAALVSGKRQDVCDLIAQAAMSALCAAPDWAVQNSVAPEIARLHGGDPWTRLAAQTVIDAIRRCGIERIMPTGVWLPRMDCDEPLVLFFECRDFAHSNPELVSSTIQFPNYAVPAAIIRWRKEQDARAQMERADVSA